MSFFKKAPVVPATMSDVQAEFTAKAQNVLDTQTSLAEAAEAEAVELERKASLAKVRAKEHTKEVNKANTFINKVSKMFE